MSKAGEELLAALQQTNLKADISFTAADVLAAFLNAEYDAIALLNNEPRMLYVNKNYERIVGLKPEEIIGKCADDLVKEGLFEEAPSLEVIKTKKTYSFFQKTKNNNDVLITANPLLDSKNNIILIIDNIRDVTDLTRLKKESLNYRLKNSRYEREIVELRARGANNSPIVAHSSLMRKVIEVSIKAAAVDSNVLITGESGVGKGVVAKFIHDCSLRNNGPYIQINCSTIPENLFESELFGYDEGAFSGARRKGKPGLLEIADKGTLLLDEVGELPLSMQAKLLNFLQERRFFRVGGSREVLVDVRIIAATNSDLEQKISKNEFREDLYYRLNVIPVSIPPLRERTDDIIPMAAMFLERLNKQYNRQKLLTFEAEAALKSYPWPGNVRQLENVIERLVILSEDNLLTDQEVQKALMTRKNTDAEKNMNLHSINVNSLISWPEAVHELEYQLLKMASQRFSTARQIGRALQISHPTVSKKLKKYNITINDKS